MSEAEARAQVTLSRETIHNADEPRHYMRIKPVKGEVRVRFAGKLLAASRRALRVLEAGRDIYDPVFYLPAADVRADLSPTDKRTFCPLKGRAGYFDLISEQGEVEASEIAWSYWETLDCAEQLKDLIAFDAARVAFEEQPDPAGAAG